MRGGGPNVGTSSSLKVSSAQPPRRNKGTGGSAPETFRKRSHAWLASPRVIIISRRDRWCKPSAGHNDAKCRGTSGCNLEAGPSARRNPSGRGSTRKVGGIGGLRIFAGSTASAPGAAVLVASTFRAR